MLLYTSHAVPIACLEVDDAVIWFYGADPCISTFYVLIFWSIVVMPLLYNTFSWLWLYSMLKIPRFGYGQRWRFDNALLLVLVPLLLLVPDIAPYFAFALWTLQLQQLELHSCLDWSLLWLIAVASEEYGRTGWHLENSIFHLASSLDLCTLVLPKIQHSTLPSHLDLCTQAISEIVHSTLQSR